MLTFFFGALRTIEFTQFMLGSLGCVYGWSLLLMEGCLELDVSVDAVVFSPR